MRHSTLKFPIDRILGRSSFSLDRVLKDLDPNFISDAFSQVNLHDQTVSSVGVTFDYDLDISKQERLIQSVLETTGTDLYRYKGIIPVKGKNKKFIFQGVHMLFTGDFGEKWKRKEKRIGRCILIGKNLNKEDLQTSFAACKAIESRFSIGTRVLVRLDTCYEKGTVKDFWDDGNPYRVAVDIFFKGFDVWAPS